MEKKGTAMRFDISKRIPKENMTERVMQVMKDFDMTYEHSNERFFGDIDIDGKEWSVGLIVGGSGTGKSTIAKELFAEGYVKGGEGYTSSSVLDDMPNSVSLQEIELAFTSVGFASPPSWLKPYEVLSTGEKMRVDLARAILTDMSLVCFDEFTSVVDREIAKTASLAIQKAIRKTSKRFVAVSCHRDIIEWLMPDWIYDTDAKSFFGLGALKSPTLELTSIELTTAIRNKCGRYLGSITI